MIDGERIETTPNHPYFISAARWLAAGDLWLGARVRKSDGTYGTVAAIAVQRRPQVMYNITVAEAHTYFVGDGQWLVHNQCSGWLAGLDLSDAQRDLTRIFGKYPPSSKKCDYCAAEAIKRIRKMGLDADIVELDGPPGAKFINTRSGEQVSVTGKHYVVRITTTEGEYFIDSIVYKELFSESEGLKAVPWDTYRKLWEFDDMFDRP